MSHNRPDHPRYATPTKVVWGGIQDVVNHAHFRPNQLKVFSSLRVEIEILLSALAYITGEGYQPTCDPCCSHKHDVELQANCELSAACC